MIKLTKRLSEYLCSNYFILDNRDSFELDELAKVYKISISREDIDSLKYFNNINTLELNIFPSFKDTDFLYIANCCPNIKNLLICEQNDLYRIDLSNFKQLNELSIIHNDNLLDVIVDSNITSFTFFDNKEYDNLNQLINIINNNKNCVMHIDIIYYIGIMKNIHIDTNVKWIESIGLRQYCEVEYDNEQAFTLFILLSNIVNKYTFITDDSIDKFGILYQWMLENICFVNEDVEKYENMNNFNTIEKVFSYGKAGRVSYAKAFQLLLSVAGIPAKMVYSTGSYETIGYLDGKKVYSLLGNSDYALIRVLINGKYSYCDIAWNALTKDFICNDQLRMFLIAKEDLKIRQKFVGEGNITHSYTYKGEEDLIMYSKDRINDINKFFLEYERNNSSLVGAQLNYSSINGSIINEQKRLQEFNSLSDTYKELEFNIRKMEELKFSFLDDINTFQKYKYDFISKNIKLLKNRYLNENIQLNVLNNKLNNYEISIDLYKMFIYYIEATK